MSSYLETFYLSALVEVNWQSVLMFKYCVMEKYYNAFKFHLESINPSHNSNIDICPITIHQDVLLIYTYELFSLFLHLAIFTCIWYIINLPSVFPRPKDQRLSRERSWKRRTHSRLEQADKRNLLVFTALYAMFPSLLLGRSFALGGKGEFYVLESPEMMNTYLEL